jgi:hypothetical protein
MDSLFLFPHHPPLAFIACQAQATLFEGGGLLRNATIKCLFLDTQLVTSQNPEW